jgi:hypothetical protein
MRCYQHVGLTAAAEDFLEKNVKKVPNQICHHCKEVITTKRKVLDTYQYDAFYGNGPTLHQYELNDGDTVKEVVQAMPWSSGPIGFLCLKNSRDQLFCQWTEKEIEEMGG